MENPKTEQNYYEETAQTDPGSDFEYIDVPEEHSEPDVEEQPEPEAESAPEPNMNVPEEHLDSPDIEVAPPEAPAPAPAPVPDMPTAPEQVPPVVNVEQSTVLSAETVTPEAPTTESVELEVSDLVPMPALDGSTQEHVEIAHVPKGPEEAADGLDPINAIAIGGLLTIAAAKGLPHAAKNLLARRRS